MEVEIGCADAYFSFQLAKLEPTRWIIGLEIREAWVELNRASALREGLHNLSFGYVNVGVDLDHALAPASVDRFHVLFPDPWFKRKHQKRRIFDLELCACMARLLRPGGEIHIASDIFDVALDAMAVFEDHASQVLGFRNQNAPWSFMRDNPYRVASRREHTTIRREQRVWRMIYKLGSQA